MKKRIDCGIGLLGLGLPRYLFGELSVPADRAYFLLDTLQPLVATELH